MLSPRVRTPSKSLLGTPVRVCRNAPGSNIRVVCRVRPFLASEVGGESCLSKDQGSDTGSLHVKDRATGRSETYKLDCCYEKEDHVTYIFKMELEPILPVLFRGCNATVFAYGAAGSGKTHTIQGVGEEGLIPLSMQAILSLARSAEAAVHVSYYEIYMDRCRDLFEDKPSDIFVMEDTDGRIQLRGLSQVQVKDMQEFNAVYSRGCSRRKVGPTGLNDVSSRSHAVLSVMVNSGDVEAGKLNLIDLAGNEDNRRSGNEGVRLAESSRINQSLFALSNVINALITNEPRIPYRDSKLTRILRDSLGGTSCTVMIACLNPGSYQEAVHTLSLAAKSKQIVNKFVEVQPQTKVDMEAKLKVWREGKSKTYGKSPTKLLTPKSPANGKMFTPKSPGRLFTPGKMFTPKSPAKTFTPFQNRKLNCPPIEEDVCLQHEDHEESGISDPVRSTTDSDCLSSQPPLSEGNEAASDQTEDGKENLAPMTPFVDREALSPRSPPLSVKLRGLGSALREALSPLPCNSLISSKRDAPVSVLEPNPVYFCSPALFSSQTPLEKLKSASQTFQSTLIKEYVDVLNKGTREDLLSLKGIGHKRADYILQLREKDSSPIKELQDLKKIGLSEKLARSMFTGSIVRQLWTTPK